MKDTMIAEAVMKALTLGKLGKASLAITEMDRAFEHVEVIGYGGGLTLCHGCQNPLRLPIVYCKSSVSRLYDRRVTSY